MTKLNLNNISTFLTEPNQRYVERIIKQIATEHDCSTGQIEIRPCPPVGEDVIYVKGKFEGYLSDYE